MATFQRVGWLRIDLRMGEFIDWMARAREAGLRLASLPEPVLRRRIHDTNTGVRVHALRNEYAAVVKAALTGAVRRGKSDRVVGSFLRLVASALGAALPGCRRADTPTETLMPRRQGLVSLCHWKLARDQTATCLHCDFSHGPPMPRCLRPVGRQFPDRRVRTILFRAA